jgi:dienelactone hydrolase
MAEREPLKPDPQALNLFHREQARLLHAKDSPPGDLKSWQERRTKLRQDLFAAMGPFPVNPCPLEARTAGVVQREGYRIEKILFQSRPNVWVTASAYVPQKVQGKVPAVLAVHGHWPMARRDPVVQARCLGLVKLGFFVLAVDAFGAGERHPRPGPGTYHGALMGSTLWPVGQTLLGMQVYDNRRALDYLQNRPEVAGDRLGITGASGGGNQTMYAGALDERFRAVVPVCSVGTYQAYLQAACCVCEVLPTALRFTEEGEILGLVAPRKLMVINATKDGFQFSVGEAKKSVAYARAVFRLYGTDDLAHAIFESPHAYNQAMREAMYGWMTRWLKNEGDGKPIPEPKHEVETAEDLSCFPDGKRPEGFLFPATFAAREAQTLLQPFRALPPHKEAWEALATLSRGRLRTALGHAPKEVKPSVHLGMPLEEKGTKIVKLKVTTEPGLVMAALVQYKPGAFGRIPACLLLHLDGKRAALEHPLAAALVEAGWSVIAPDLRGTGETQPPGDAVKGAPDHNSAEHALWLGRPLLGQWQQDVSCLLSWMEGYPGYRKDRLALVGLGQAGLVALCAGALQEKRLVAVAAVDMPASLLVPEAFPSGTRMGLLAPGLLHAGDIPELAALNAPGRLALVGGIDPLGRKLEAEALGKSYSFTRDIYRRVGAAGALNLGAEVKAADLASWLGEA